MNKTLTKYIDTEILIERFTLLLPKTVAAILVLFAFWVFYKVSARGLKKILDKAGIRNTVSDLIVKNVYRTVIMIFSLIIAMGQLGIDVTAAIAGVGVAGIAIGFAAKESIGNLIAGFIILFDKPFVVDDWIVTDGEYGKVVGITLRTTRIRKRDNTYVILPNSQIINQKVINHTESGPVRVSVSIGIAYKESIDEARRVILKSIEGIHNSLTDPAPEVVVTDLGDSSVNLAIRVWTDNPAGDAPLEFAIIEAAKKALDEAKIEIPFPHLQLFVDDVKDEVVKKIKN